MVGEQIVALAFLSFVCVSAVVVTSDYTADPVTCTPYKCKLDEQAFTDETCVYYDTDAKINYIEPCDSGYECVGNLGGNFTCSVETTEKAYPGELCSQASDCDSNVCTAGFCIGKAIDQACSDDEDCAPGSYCATESTNLCSTLKPTGSACLRDEECAYGDFCKINPGSEAGKCTAYFSTASGTAINECRSEYIDWQCSTAFCVIITDSETKVSTNECSEIYTVEKPSTPCTSDDDCSATNSDKSDSINTTCKCGYSEAAHAYCEILPGNDAYSSYIRYAKLWFASGNEKNCNTSRRGNLACAEAHWDSENFYTLQYYALKTQLWAEIHDVKTCVQEAFLSEYWQARDDYLDNLTVTCPSFKAKKDSQIFEEDTCVFYEDDDEVYYVDPCNDGEVCTKGKTPTANYTCETELTSKSYPGETCLEATDCDSGVCTNTKCVGKSIGETCTKDLECNAGSYCDLATTNKCVALLVSGSECTRDWQCDYSSYCQLEADATVGKCAAYFNMAAGSEIDSCDGDSIIDLQCSSGACKTEINDSTGEESYSCLDVLAVKYPKKACDSNSDCETTLDGKEASDNSECVCGYSQSGNAYCELMPGNDEYAELIKYAKLWLASGLSSKCNTARRAEIDCIASYWDTENLYALLYYGYRTEYWTQIWDVETEIKETFATDYWEAKETYELNLPVECDAYKCKTKSIKFAQDTCVYYDTDNSVYYVEECDDDEVCTPGTTSTSNYTCVEESDSGTLAYPGEECDHDSDCHSKHCSSDLCVGYSFNDTTCSADNECAYGLYCDTVDTKVCLELLPLDSTCSRNEQCTYGSFCYKSSTDALGTCKKYLSVTTGSEIDACGDDYVSFKCATGYCVEEYDESLGKTTYTCSELFTVENLLTCSKDNDCIAYNVAKTDTTYSDCNCGYSKSGTGFCELMPGNEAYAQYLVYFLKWLASGKENKCNTSIRHTLGCMEAHWDENNYYNLAYYKYRTEQWYQIQDVDSCTKKVFATEYWEAKEDLDDYKDDDDDGAFSLVFTAIAALLLLA